jgi:hypothetical protein
MSLHGATPPFPSPLRGGIKTGGAPASARQTLQGVNLSTGFGGETRLAASQAKAVNVSCHCHFDQGPKSAVEPIVTDLWEGPAVVNRAEDMRL